MSYPCHDLSRREKSKAQTKKENAVVQVVEEYQK